MDIASKLLEAYRNLSNKSEGGKAPFIFKFCNLIIEQQSSKKDIHLKNDKDKVLYAFTNFTNPNAEESFTEIANHIVENNLLKDCVDPNVVNMSGGKNKSRKQKSKSKRSKTKRSKTKRSKTKRSKTKRSKTKRRRPRRH
jgi:hypothetical protein